MSRPHRLLVIAHAFAVGLNRRLVHELSRVGGDAWEVTAAAPTYFHGRNDLGPVSLGEATGESYRLVPVPAHLTRFVHVFVYGAPLRALVRERWDMIHCSEEPYILVGGQVAWWTPRGTRLVYRTAQSIQKRYPPPFNWIERYALKRSAGCICSGHTVAAALADRTGYRERPMRVIPLGVDVEHFQHDSAAGKETRRRLGWQASGPPVVGFLGRFVAEKGLDLLMRRLDGLAAPWRALFIGEGPLEAALRAWAARHGERVRILTGIRHDSVARHLNAMDLLCAPSLTTKHWREQFGRMLIEAFACGVPVVASDSGEIPYVVADAGVIVGERDEAGWASALSDLLENPARRAELAALGLERARALYAWPVVAGQHLDFFSELLDSPSASAR